MGIKFLNRQFSKWSGKRSLRTVLIIAFMSQVFTAVALTGVLSFYNGQEAVDDLATQLRSEMTARIHQHLQTYMGKPHLVNQLNVDAIHLGHLDLSDISKLDTYFWHQIQRFNTVSYIGLATVKGEYIGAQARSDGSIIIEILETESQGKLKTWETDNYGNRIKVSRTILNYDPLQRPWYQAALKAGQAVWTDIYVYFAGWSTTISANQPIYDSQGEILGVATADLTLLKIGHFLKKLKIGEQGQTFIMERSGLLVSTSTEEKPYRINPTTRQAEQFLATESADILTRETAHYLMQYFGELSQITHNQQLDFSLAGERQFLQIMPYQDQWGLNWYCVVVVPESDFMARINANTRATIFLCLVALVIAILIAVVIARWIVQPLQDLNTTAQALAIGEWRQLNEIKRQDEIGELAQVFNRMSQELQVSFNHLEEKVEERTQNIADQNIKLMALNEELDQLNQDKNEFLGIVAHDLKNPLAAIEGAALLIESDYDDLLKEDVIEFANIISTSSQQLFELIKNLLDVNQIESGKIRLSLTDSNVLPILKFLVKEYREKASLKGIRLICNCDEEKYQAYIDENSLRQVLDNLISNAVKYSSPGKHIIVSLSQNEKGVRCEIQDEGPGLSESDQQKLFGKFMRLSAQPTGEEHSTGLGLFIVKKLVEAMKGRVWCESELGQGALFIVELPNKETAQNNSQK
jgi:signal transduction histidine kinase